MLAVKLAGRVDFEDRRGGSTLEAHLETYKQLR